MKALKSKKNADRFFIFCFLAFIFTAMIVTALRDKQTYDYFENRNLAVMPDFSVRGVLDGNYMSRVDTYLADHTAARKYFLAGKTLADLYVFNRKQVNDVVVTGSMLLPRNNFETVNPEAVRQKAAELAVNLSQLDELVSGYGGQYYYVAVPCQYAYFEDEYPWYLNNRGEYTDESITALKAALDEAGVGFIDMGAVFEQMGNPARLYSSVDNHYTIYGAYLTYVTILERVNADAGHELAEILREDDFTVAELENNYLGSRLRKLFNLWRSDERLSILTPNEEVAFTRWDNGAQSEPVVYSMPADSKQNVLYSLYMGGDIASTVIDTGRGELPSILVYGDSFTNAVECILYYSFDQMHSLDLRHYGDMTLGEYIEAFRPEVVVCIRDYEAALATVGNGAGAQ